MIDRNLFPEWKKEQIIKNIKSLFPDEIELAMLSLYGSRAGGWAAPTSDYDINGYFLISDREWFSSVRRGLHGNDIEVSNWNCVKGRIKGGDCSQIKFFKMSNPFYITDNWDQQEFMSYLKPEMVREDIMNYNQNAMNRSHVLSHALHSYLEGMASIWFLKYGEVETNVMKMNKEFNYSYLSELVEIYHRNREDGKPNNCFDVDKADDELSNIKEILIKTKEEVVGDDDD